MKWEYQSIKLGAKGFLGGVLDTDEFDAYLNELGEEAWELVVAFDTSQSGGQTRDVVAVFKRPA